MIPATKKTHKLKHLTEAYKEIKVINKLINTLSPKNYQRNNIFVLQDYWVKKRDTVEAIAASHMISIDIPTFINSHNIVLLRQELKDLNKTLLHKYDLLNQFHMEKALK